MLADDWLKKLTAKDSILMVRLEDPFPEFRATWESMSLQRVSVKQEFMEQVLREDIHWTDIKGRCHNHFLCSWYPTDIPFVRAQFNSFE